MSYELKGVDELKKKLAEKAKLNMVKQIVKLNGAEMQKKAMDKVPVDTGNLKRSIRLDIEDGGLTARVSANAEYAGYVEWGTRYQAAQPYMRPAQNEQKIQFDSDLKKLT